MAETSHRRPLAAVAFDAGALVLLGALLAWATLRLGSAPPAGAWPWMAGAALLGVALADLGTGLVHWAGDRFGSERTPLLGGVVIGPFREHHRDPLGIVRHGLLEVSGNNALAMCPFAWLVACHAPRSGEPVVAVALSALVALIATALASNQLHRWAHMARVPRPVAWLQRHRLILSRVEHSRHHRGAHDCGYCVVNGWMNPLLDRLTARPRPSRVQRG